MKELILIVALFMVVSIAMGQEYRVVCNRTAGCPVKNGTCPTCEIIARKKSASEKLDEKIIHTKNSLGFRGDEPPDDFNPALTVVTVGGSTTESIYISDGKT